MIDYNRTRIAFYFNELYASSLIAGLTYFASSVTTLSIDRLINHGRNQRRGQGAARVERGRKRGSGAGFH